ncbi:bifunctional phosphatase PAP2/diacylglycerol kinase family protein [Streptomyces violascens]|uniref:Phosphoesterase n=1 Tax=Streptomyces violascens TaxID=67381 RepID=A0ABQ3QWY2_9ACTN|nr:bifunctional phosphatase PAP2/diacylglycerol kinase family protein [Streptomyces violascens]GGU12411.1 phosphoesterase [Streptomyces violascens]GHI41790.1 phosphoesterase [Streptomyces violascens]
MTHSTWHKRLGAHDRALFHFAATRHWPAAETVLPRLSRAANHGALWFAAATAMGATRSPRARRAALRGVASLALASLTVNTVAKHSVRRARPLLDAVPLVRQLKRRPVTTSFPSGHAASAAAFVTGVALESRAWGAALAPVGFSVAASRVYTGVHYPGDVVAGAALGVGAALAVRGLVPTRTQLPPPGRPRADAPALPAGQDLVVVANRASGTALAKAALVRSALPLAEVVECDPDDLPATLEKAAGRGRVLGVCGGDGTVNLAASVAARLDVPLAVFPGGTLNHFALDLGIEEVQDTCRALASGDAVRVDLGRFRPGPNGADAGYFLNTFSLGVYPELVRVRERWSPRIGSWAAGILGAYEVLRGERPLRADPGGSRPALWLLFAGNCVYQRLGPAPARRYDLADGLLDVRAVRGGRLPGLRLLAAALAGPLHRSPVHTSRRMARLRIPGLAAGTSLAYDGEVAAAPRELTLDKLPEALTVYRPQVLRP